MSRLSSDYSHNEKSSQLLAGVEKSMGKIPNIFKKLGNSAPALEGYLAFSAALGKGVLSAADREHIALVVAGFNECEYCVSAHTQIAQKVGISAEETKKNIHGASESPRVLSLMNFCLAIVKNKGFVSDQEVEAIRQAGFSDEAIVEIVAKICLDIFTNYFNHVADTELDFPKVSLD